MSHTLLRPTFSCPSQNCINLAFLFQRIFLPFLYLLCCSVVNLRPQLPKRCAHLLRDSLHILARLLSFVKHFLRHFLFFSRFFAKKFCLCRNAAAQAQHLVSAALRSTKKPPPRRRLPCGQIFLKRRCSLPVPPPDSLSLSHTLNAESGITL